MVLSSSTIKDGPPSPLEKANREINRNLNDKLGFICKQSVGARIARPFKMIVISRRTANGRPYVSNVQTSR